VSTDLKWDRRTNADHRSESQPQRVWLLLLRRREER